MMAKSSAAWRPDLNGAAMSEGKNWRLVSVTCWAWGSVDKHVRAQQLLHRVVPEQGGEQGGDRREGRDPVGRRRRDAVGHQPVVEAGGQRADSPMIMRVKKMPMERTCAEFMNVVFIPEPTPRCSAGRLFITPARLGEPNTPWPAR
jgi:hypothetical protein